ncbi:hypothetical protein ACQP3F_33885, partial [Escherichia coli]
GSTRGHLSHQKSSSKLRQRPSCSTTDHIGQKTREEIKTKEQQKQKPHPTKTNPEIKTYTYNHPKPRCVSAGLIF